ncbi:MAG TPA: hypothetical protein VK066_08110 [Chloroflexota bacterium]|nr:hypothetical protein [Chloroflexota bacterium]
MWRMLVALALVGLMGRPAAVAAQDEGCPDTPEDTASELVGEYLAGGQWDLAYDVLHPEAQLRVPRQVFAAARQAQAIAAPILDVEVFPADVHPAWTWGVTGTGFTAVSEVPVRVARGAPLGTVSDVEMIPLVRVGDCWRWLPPRLP